MAFDMEFLKLIIFFLFISFHSFSCNLNTSKSSLYIKYIGQNINGKSYEDSLFIKHAFNQNLLELNVNYKDSTKRVLLKFNSDGIYCSSIKDKFELFVKYINKSDITENSCYLAYPIFGKYNGWLGSKKISIDNKFYLVQKYYIEREDNPYTPGVEIYFLDDFGFLIFHFEGGNYLVPDKIIGNTNIPFERVIAEIKKDTSFSRLQPIPPTPPPPNPSKQ